jgi:hypothetical protein
MLFLLNLVVVPLQETVQLPRGLESLAGLSPAGVLKAGVQLYDKHPSLETERPDMARWFCTLLASKFPSSSAAIFRERLKGPGFEACVADVPFETLARLWRFQRQGDQIQLDVYQQVWARARMLA